jgi:hypothetical protein
MRRVWVPAFLAPLVAACGLVGGIEDITVTGFTEVDESGVPIPRDDSGDPIPLDGAPPPRDGQTDGGGNPDAKNTRCDPLSPFGAPALVAALNTAQDEASPRLSADELTVYLSSDRPGRIGAGSVFVAKRAAIGDAFGAPTLMPAINTASGVVYHPAASGDGLRVVLQVSFGGPTDLYLATRGNTGVDFTTPTPLNVVNSGQFEFLPFVTSDGVNLYFSSNRAGPFQLYQSIAAAGVFAAPTLVPGTGTGTRAERRHAHDLLCLHAHRHRVRRVQLVRGPPHDGDRDVRSGDAGRRAQRPKRRSHRRAELDLG